MLRRPTMLGPLLAAVCLAWLAAASPSAQASHRLVLRFRDATSQEVTACRLEILGPSGWLFDEPDSLLKSHRRAFGAPFVEVEDSLSLDLEPGSYEIRAVRGIHGVPLVVVEDVQADLDRTLLLDRWIDPHAFGWIGADPHVHHFHEAPDRPYPALTPEELGRLARAEALDVLFVLANDPLHPGGPMAPPEPRVSLVWGEEYRNHFWGHVVLLGLTDLVLNGSTAGCCDLSGYAWPTLEARLRPETIGAALVAHPHTTDDMHHADYWPGTGLARERAALALGDLVAGIAVGGITNGPVNWAVGDYLDGVRAGARWAAIGETDRYLAGYDMGPAGLIRTYAKIEPEVPADPQAYGDAWLAAVRQQRSFATTGPFLETFLVEGQIVGSTVNRAGPSSVSVRVDLSSQEPIERVTIHGATGTHWEAQWPGGRTSLDTTLTLAVTTDDFFLVEAEGPAGASHLDIEGPRLVSSPIWVELGIPWAVAAEVARRGADGLIHFWGRSLLARGYATPADSLAAREYLLGAAAAYEAMHDDPPGPFWLTWPPEAWESPSTEVFFQWTASRSFDGEPSTYELEVADSPDFDPILSTTATPDTFATVGSLGASETFYWRVAVSEPGEPPRSQEDPPRSLTVRSQPVAVTGQGPHEPGLRLSVPREVAGGVELHMELTRASRVRMSWFDVRGRRLGGEGPRWRAAGMHTLRWDGRDLRGVRVASGVYWLVVDAERDRAVQRVVLIEP